MDANNRIENYINNLNPERQSIIRQLKELFSKNLPTGFEETFNYGMIGFIVPLSLYPKGYLNKNDTPLPLLNLASQKNHIALYHMGLYASTELLSWFSEEYKNQCAKKPDMGKSCIRFKESDTIPIVLLEQLARKLTVDEWIRLYETISKK